MHVVHVNDTLLLIQFNDRKTYSIYLLQIIIFTLLAISFDSNEVINRNASTWCNFLHIIGVQTHAFFQIPIFKIILLAS